MTVHPVSKMASEVAVEQVEQEGQGEQEERAVPYRQQHLLRRLAVVTEELCGFESPRAACWGQSLAQVVPGEAVVVEGPECHLGRD